MRKFIMKTTTRLGLIRKLAFPALLPRGKNSMRMKIAPAFVCLMILMVSIATVVNAAPADVDENDVYWWWGDPAGSSKIVRNNKGVSGDLYASLSNSVGSAEDLAVTLWIIVFNYPGECETAYACGADADFVNPAVMPDALYGAGNIVDSSEVVSFGFHRKAGDNSGSIADLFGMPTDDGEPFGLRNPRGAEIHYVVRLHGPMIPLEMPDQIKSYGGGCVFDAPYGFPSPLNEDELRLGWGECQDVQFAVNPP
jgi:hypothetical protein